MNFQDDTPSIAFNIFKDYFAIVFELTSIQGAPENCRYPELVGEPLRLELNFNFRLDHVTELILWWRRTSLKTVGMFGVAGKNI